MAGVKIVDLPALGRDLINTDLLEVSLNGGGSRKITGQEIMNASKLAIGSTPIVSGTVGRLLFQGTGNVLQQSGNLFWDNPNLRLGIGISTPLYTLDVAGNIHGNSIFAEYNIVSSAGNVWLGNGYAIGDWGTGNNRIEFYSNRLSFFGNGNEALRIVGSTGNLLVNTVTDAGFKLDVNGTAIVRGILNVNSALTGLSFSNADCNIFNNGGGAGNISFSMSGSKFLNIWQITGSSSGYTSGTHNTIETSRSYAWSSGTAISNVMVVSPTINNTGTYSGIFRGFYYNPTLTSLTGTTHRAIDLTSGDFVWGTGYSQYYGNSVEGFIQFNISGSTTQMWMRPPNNPNNYGPSYYSKISQTNADLTINSGQYGSLYLGSNGSNGANASMVLFNASANTLCNVLIGTTTNAGYRLDVNGTARVVNTLSVNTGNVSGQGIQMGSDSNIGIFNNGGIMQLRQYSYSFELAGGGTNVFLRTDGNRIQTRAEYGMALGTYNVTTANPSAILEAYSTTKGFLPPRMTNAQRAAIASPAVGLIVYCTDATEGLYVYKSTGWTFMV